MMKIKKIQWLASVLMGALLLSLHAYADDTISPAMPANLVSLTTIEPERDAGYTVGDILERTVKLQVKKPYTLVKSSLPIVGYERRYKGQIIGIELKTISTSEESSSDSTTYTLKLAYQVFTNNIVAKPAFLPAETIKFTGDNKVYQFRVPEWGFRISPIAIYGSVKLEDDMSPLRGPLLMSSSKDHQRLQWLRVVFGLSLLGLLYILGARAWLPMMGKPFARALRDIRKLPKDAQGLQQAVSRVHQSFNTTAGNSVFSDNLDGFISSNPGFAPIRADIEKFFGLSRQVFFEPQAAHSVGDNPALWLQKFVRACRDCERGLKPDAIKV